MAIRYTIESEYPDYPHLPRSCETRQRADAAADSLWGAIFAMLEGQGLRDRPIAWNLLRQFRACEVSPPPIGYLREERFDCGSERVTFRAERVRREYRTHERHGFLISRTAGADAPWSGWREDGVTFRADTLSGAFAMAREFKGN